MIAFTAVCNATGVPAMSVPLEWTADGLPIGMHFVGRSAPRRRCSRSPPNSSAGGPGETATTREDKNERGMSTIMIGFIAGVLSVLVFHQVGFYLANELGSSRAPSSTT